MKTPKYTDLHRYPNGYRKSTNTDITLTFKRAKAEQARIEEEKKLKVRKIGK